MSVNSLRSGELARLTGVSADTLRHYERLGILPTSQRTDGGYRMFPASAVERVHLGQQIQDLQRTQDYMRKLVRGWRKRLKLMPPGSKAMLLHSLVAKPRTKSNNLKRRTRS